MTYKEYLTIPTSVRMHESFNIFRNLTPIKAAFFSIFNTIYDAVELDGFGYSTLKKRQKTVSGVYMIDDVYVGESIHIRKRIRSHILDTLNNRHTNSSLQDYLKWRLLSGNKIKVMLLSTNQNKERQAIKELRDVYGFPLKNVSKGKT